MPQVTKQKCLTPECRNEKGQYKSLCMKCYSEAKAVVEGGKATWEQLAEMGLAEVQLTPFAKAFKERSESANGQ